MRNRIYTPLCSSINTHTAFGVWANTQRCLWRRGGFETELHSVRETCLGVQTRETLHLDPPSVLHLKCVAQIMIHGYSDTESTCLIRKKSFFWKTSSSLSTGEEAEPPVRLARQTSPLFIVQRLLREVVIVRLSFYLAPSCWKSSLLTSFGSFG